MCEQQERNIEIIKKIYELSEGNMDEAKGYLHPEMMSHEASSLPYGGSYKGPDGYERLVKTMYNAWEDHDIRVEQYIAGEDCVIVLLRFSARGKKTGKVFSMPMAELWRIKDGKVIELRPFYFDTKRACEVFGD